MASHRTKATIKSKDNNHARNARYIGALLEACFFVVSVDPIH
jgi:hypothetical protein